METVVQRTNKRKLRGRAGLRHRSALNLTENPSGVLDRILQGNFDDLQSLESVAIFNADIDGKDSHFRLANVVFRKAVFNSQSSLCFHFILMLPPVSLTIVCGQKTLPRSPTRR